MKRFILVITALIMISLCACSPLRLSELVAGDYVAEANLNQVLEAITNKDKELLLSMFSDEALEEAEDIEFGMQYIFDLFSGEIESIDLYGGNVSESYDYGNKSSVARYAYYVTTSSEKYLLFLYSYPEYDECPEKIGLYMLQLIRAEDQETQYDSGHDILCAGIYVPNEPENT